MGIELSFAERELRSVDRLAGEVVLAALFAEERPPRGLAGLLDWRLGGKLSRLCQSGFLTGAEGELVLLPGRPGVPFDKVIIVGLGARARFDERLYVQLLTQALGALDGLGARRATLELPGRHASAIDAAKAFEGLSTRTVRADAGAALEALTIVDDGEGQRAYAEMTRIRRR